MSVIEDLFAGLNDQQHQAVTSTNGPCLILAGPGSGKTRVVTCRIAHLLELGVKPSEILAITFTKKAATEMQERIAELLGNTPKALTISTFHSLGFRILREQHSGSQLCVVNDKQRLAIAETILETIGHVGTSTAEVLSEISKAKNFGQSVERFSNSASSDFEKHVAHSYELYETELAEKQAIDLDDMILHPLRLFQDNQELAERYQRRYTHILIDEYQDTNGPQHDLVNLLCPRQPNLCVVGDDDQSIYGFRGSETAHIMRFVDDFPGASVTKLETNYRSTKQIVDLSSQVIERSTERYPKRLASHHGPGSEVTWRECAYEEEEQEKVGSLVSELAQEANNHRDIAILFRSGKAMAQMKAFLSKADIPCGGTKGVNLLTYHGAKGLEFPAVILPSLEENGLPSWRALQDANVDEERRLFYVGMTRAKSQLFLFSSANRNGYSRTPSRFLTELEGLI